MINGMERYSMGQLLYLATSKRSSVAHLFPSGIKVPDCMRDDGDVLVGKMQRVIVTDDLIQ
jgi:hypothetical protein